MKIYSVIITVIAVAFLILAGYFYRQVGVVKNDLVQSQNQLHQTKDQLQQTQGELSGLRNIVETGLASAKLTTAILQGSLETFLVAGNTKVAALGESEAKAISDEIQNFPEKMNKISFEDGWSRFLKSRTISDYLAFSRSLAQTLKSNLENIH